MTQNIPQHTSGAGDFYLTPPAPCAYLEGQVEQRIFTPLIGKNGASLNDTLSQLGFRRSQLISYRPACSACRACVFVTRFGE